MTRIVAALVLYLLLVLLFAWFADSVGGAGFWSNFGEVFVFLPVAILAYLGPVTALIYFIGVIWSNDWGWVAHVT